jgi:putative peptidoglycan lipid II flippase
VTDATSGAGGDPAASPAGGRLLGSAAILAAGNIASRLLGLLRETSIAALYDVGPVTSALRVAASVPTLINDLLINGQLSAAVVPVLASYRAKDRHEFWEAVSVLLTVAALVTGLAGALVYLFANQIAWLLGAGLGVAGVDLITSSLHILAPAVMLLGLVGMVTGVLFARERFGLPALAMASFNATFLVVLWSTYRRLGPYALPAAMTASAFMQLMVMVPGLRGGRVRPRLDWRHPALRRVLVLYLPILLGLLIEQSKNVVDTRLATEASPAAYGIMQFATRLVQFPHGLVSVAIALAILPTLAAHFARGETEDYTRTLGRGLRLVMALALPAAIGMAVLAQAAVGAAYQYRRFGADDRVIVALALVVYLIGLPFASIDWPLNYAFYARQNTWLPAAVGVVSVAAYLVVAVAVGPVLNLAGLGAGYVFLGLVLADSVKHVVHANLMLVLVRRKVGPEALAGLARTTGAGLAASLVMAGVVLVADRALGAVLPDRGLAWLVRLVAGGVVGVAVYVPLAARLGVGEVPWVVHVVRARLGRS